MSTIESTLEQLTEKAIVGALIDTLSQNFEDFAPVKERYEKAMGFLREELGTKVQDEENAIEQQTVSNLLFSGFLGLKANLEHFTDPVARVFLEVDTETYLREITAKRMPVYCHAQDIRNRFYGLLTPEQRTLYEDITAYVGYLETAGPMLAHYYGYLLGNKLLCWVIPGYHDDPILTARYQMMLKAYFGKQIQAKYIPTATFTQQTA